MLVTLWKIIKCQTWLNELVRIITNETKHTCYMINEEKINNYTLPRRKEDLW